MVLIPCAGRAVYRLVGEQPRNWPDEVLELLEDPFDYIGHFPHGLVVVRRQRLTIRANYRERIAREGDRSEELRVDQNLDRAVLSEVGQLDLNGHLDSVPGQLEIDVDGHLAPVLTMLRRCCRCPLGRCPRLDAALLRVGYERPVLEPYSPVSWMALTLAWGVPNQSW